MGIQLPVSLAHIGFSLANRPDKVLDVRLLEEGLDRNREMLTRLKGELEPLLAQTEKLISMGEAFKGEGGSAILGFYEACHIPFLKYAIMFCDEATSVMARISSALSALEPSPDGYIDEPFLEAEVEQGLIEIGRLTDRLTNETNAIMDSVSDIVALPHLDDSVVQEGIRDSRKKKDDTVNDLNQFDAESVGSLSGLFDGANQMTDWINRLAGLFQEGALLTEFEQSQWKVLTYNSKVRSTIEDSEAEAMKACAPGDEQLLVGTEVTPATLKVLEAGKKETIERSAYGNYASLRFHVYDNGLVIKEYANHSGDVKFEVAAEVEKEFVDGGVRELDNMFDETPLAFIHYVDPRSLLRKIGKKGILALTTNRKPVKVKDTPSKKNADSSKVTVVPVEYGKQYTRQNRKKVLRANVEYISSHGYKYQTDSLGRIQSASGKLTKGQAKRNQYAQSNVGGVDRKGDDHGGHLIASIFNGSGDIDNLVPMNGKLNQGAYRSIENQWKKALDASPPKKVEVNIRPVYEGNSNRPVEFEIEYKIDNEKFDAVLPNY
ncbi:T7SS effector LXG polymorphic toxin [Bhargavaea beijingensis]|nr:T7SS effector LXG polymorphic toxin [Bhargavaea beijingensis]MCW1928971.1 T7SS effector LXG polymorphic toxin [Bhargavaea beijingensis]SDD76554.1 Predicted ribonuclease, toxin component of the YeeF-YezG toxin-antitoxin module [Bhargavaea beijingensis]